MPQQQLKMQDALDEFDRAEELLRQAQEEKDGRRGCLTSQNQMRARPKTAAAQSVVDDYRSGRGGVQGARALQEEAAEEFFMKSFRTLLSVVTGERSGF